MAGQDTPKSSEKPTHTSRRTQKERREEAEAKLVDASMTLIAERGLARLTLAEVGDAAGFSRGLPAHHFGTKIGLIEAVGRETEKRLLAELFPEEGAKTGLEALLQTVSAFFFMDDIRPIRVLLEFQKSGSTLESAYRKPLLRFFGIVQARLEGAIRQGQRNGEIRQDADPARFAEFLLASLRGLILQQLLTDQSVKTEALLSAYVANIRRRLSLTD